MEKLEELKKKVEEKGLDYSQVWKDDYERFWSLVRDLRFWFEYSVNISEEGVKEFNKKYMELRKELLNRFSLEDAEHYCQRVITVVSFVDL
jgi:hypothetical protein